MHSCYRRGQTGGGLTCCRNEQFGLPMVVVVSRQPPVDRVEGLGAVHRQCRVVRVDRQRGFGAVDLVGRLLVVSGLSDVLAVPLVGDVTPLPPRGPGSAVTTVSAISAVSAGTGPDAAPAGTLTSGALG
jgi:hypothetical protein